MMGYSQRALAREVGVSNAFLSQIERGERNPGPRVARKIADTLATPYEALFLIVNTYSDAEEEDELNGIQKK